MASATADAAAMRFPATRWWLGLGIVLVTAACASSGDPSTTSRELAERWAASAPSPQTDALEDLEVTGAEYEQALLATKACMESRGFVTSPLRELPDGIRRDFAVEVSDGATKDPTAAWGDCSRQHLLAVESVYLAQHARPARDFDDLRDELVACLEDNGISGVTHDMTDAQIAETLVAQDGSVDAWVCRERFLILTGSVGARPPE